jgi:hypothetical protein
MLHREIIADCSEIQTKHINTLCGQNVELLNIKLEVHIFVMNMTLNFGKLFSNLFLCRKTCKSNTCVTPESVGQPYGQQIPSGQIY